MLDLFRQRGLSNVIYGLIIATMIFAFVLTFRPQAQSKTASLSETCVARVRGRCIDPKDFAAAYRMIIPSRSQAQSRRLNLKKVALDGLVERELLDDEAKRLGISVTDKEVTDQLYDGYVRVSLPSDLSDQGPQILHEMYQAYVGQGLVPPDVAQEHLAARDTAIPVDFRDPKTKKFDLKTYERRVRALSNRSTTEFREEQSRELLAAKVRDVIREPVRIGEGELWEAYDRQKSTASVTYIPVKEAWVARWAVQVSDAEVDAWVKGHQDEYNKILADRTKDDDPKAGHFRHILVKTPYGATDDEKAAALAKLSWAVGRIKAGEPFAEVAREVSDDPGSAAKGGDLGDKTDNFVTPFKAAANALKPGDSTPGAVSTQFGYHYIERDDPSKQADIEATLKKWLGRSLAMKAKAGDVTQALAARIDAAMRSGTSAEDAIQSTIFPYVKPQKIDLLKVMPAPPEASDAGADAAAPDKATAPGPLPIKSFDAGTDNDRPETQTSTAFNRGGDPFQGLSPEGQTKVVGWAFAAKEGDVLDGPVRTTDAWSVIQLKQRTIATKEDFEKDRAAFTAERLGMKRDEVLSLYVRRLRDRAKDDIKIDDSFIQESKPDGGESEDDEDDYP